MAHPFAAEPLLSAAILVVDDEAQVLAALKEQLEREGYAVVACSSALKALEAVRDRPFSVIISDHRMPEMTGLEFLCECKELQPRASRILITAVLTLPTVVEAINRGEIFRFIAKPWLREELAATVRNAVQRFELVLRNEHLTAETQRLNTELTTANTRLAAQVSDLEGRQQALDAVNAELAQSYEHSLELCGRILTTYDPFLGGQARTLVELAHRMAATEHFTPEERQVLRTSAWLCDLGLIGVPRELLRTFRSAPDQLSDRDRRMLESHPVYSQTLASFIDAKPAVGETVRAHHERFDGHGYPDRLAGFSIPWPARCLAVAVFFAECGLPKEQAAEAVLAESGRAFDPEAVRLFFKCTHALALPRRMREVLLDELTPGMTLANGLHSPHGLLLVGEGQTLNAHTIEKLRMHNLTEPISQRLLVYS